MTQRRSTSAPYLVGHGLRCGHVAERLAHLAAGLVQHEAVRHHGLERCGTARADGFQQRGLEPAAVLVRALEVEVRRPGQATVTQREGVGRAALEPHVDDVHHLLVVRRVPAGAEEAGGRRREPRVRAIRREPCHDAGDDRRVTQRLAGGAVDEDRDRHSPGALAADAPVGAAGDHGADAVAALRRHERRHRDGGQRAGADLVRPVQADEPLRRGAVDQRRLGPPGVRVGMHEPAAPDQPARRLQRRADRGGRLEDVDAGEERDGGHVAAVLAHALGDGDAVGAAQREILLAMRRRHVHQAGPLLGGDEVTQQDRRVVVVALAAKRVGAERPFEVRPVHDLQQVVRGDAERRADRPNQVQRHQDRLARPRQRALGHAVHAELRVVDGGAGSERAVARHGPGRRGPDHHRSAGERARQDGEAHPDRVAGVVVVLDLGFRQGGLLHRGPHHRAQPAVERAVQQEGADLAGDGGLGAVIHGGVARGPVTGHAQALELGRLHLQPALRVGAALGAEIQHRHGVLVAAGAAVLLLHLPLDRQAVAVPAGDVVRVEPGHAVRAHDHVLEDAVQRVADMQVPVGVDRPVMQDERGAARGGLPRARPQSDALPPGEDLRFALGQLAAQRELRRGQEDGVAVVGHSGIRRHVRQA